MRTVERTGADREAVPARLGVPVVGRHEVVYAPAATVEVEFAPGLERGLAVQLALADTSVRIRKREQRLHLLRAGSACRYPYAQA